MKKYKRRTKSYTDLYSSIKIVDLSFDKKRLVKEIKRRSRQLSEDTKPLFHATDIKCFLREDIPIKGLTEKQALKNAKQKKGNFFISPRTFEKDE